MSDHSTTPRSYPLDWPADRPRTEPLARKPGKFLRRTSSFEKPTQLTIESAVNRLITEVTRISAQIQVLSSNIERRQDGGFRSSRIPGGVDPGVALYLRRKGQDLVLACDRYDHPTQNVAAIAAHIDALRAIERHGVATVEQMMVGMLALPAPPGEPWYERLGRPASFQQARAEYARLTELQEPNDSAAHRELTEAITAARTYFRTKES